MTQKTDDEQKLSPRREALWRIIFLSDTPAGRGFDVALLVAIAFSNVIDMLETVAGLQVDYGDWMRRAEWLLPASLRLSC